METTDRARNDHVEGIDEAHIHHGKILRGWDAVDKRIRDSDESKVEDFKEDVDTLLVFAGLFSAVTTALLIESYKFLQEDQTETTNVLLAQVYLHLVNASTPPPPLDRIVCVATSSCPFSPSTPARRINYLWFSSLMLSLVTASFGMLVKQWLREYLSGNFAVGKSHLRLRFFRYVGMMKWRVFKIASLLPLLLQLALALFFAGLCLFASEINSKLGFLITAIVAVWAVLFILILAAPALSPWCPYKVTFLKEFMHYVRLLLTQYLHVEHGLMGRHSELSQLIARHRQISTSPFEEELYAVNQASLAEDMDVLLAVDCELLDDGLLETGITGLLLPITSESSSDITQVKYRLDQLIIPWVLEVIKNRVQNRRGTRMDLFTRMPLNGELSIKAWTAVVDILSHTVLYSLQNSEVVMRTDDWIAAAITVLISDSGYALPVNGQRALSECLRQNAGVSAAIMCKRIHAPLFSLFNFDTSTKLIGDDAFVMLLKCGVGDALRHLHGDDLLRVMHELLSCRYGCSTSEKHCTHHTLPEFLFAHVYVTGFPRVRLDDDGGFCRIMDTLLDELENVFRTPPTLSLPSWVLTAVEVTFTYFQKRNTNHSPRIIDWMSQAQTLLWYLQLAKPVQGENDGADCQTVSDLIVSVTKDLVMNRMSSAERKVTLRLVSDILKADCDPSVMEDPSVLRIDHLGLCELLLNLLQWELQSPPDPIQSMQRALMNAWRTTLERLCDVIQMTDGPASDAESEVIVRIITLGRKLTAPAEFKLDKALDALLVVLGKRKLGPLVAQAIHNWKLLRRAGTSMNESIEALAFQQDSVVSLSGYVEGQNHDSDDRLDGTTNGTIATDGNSSGA